MTGGVIGFEAVSGGREGRVGVEEVSHGAGTEFQVVMKQLGKRDPTTKIKVNRYGCQSVRVLAA